jgi:hypothetical protein
MTSKPLTPEDLIDGCNELQDKYIDKFISFFNETITFQVENGVDIKENAVGVYLYSPDYETSNALNMLSRRSWDTIYKFLKDAGWVLRVVTVTERDPNEGKDEEDCVELYTRYSRIFPKSYKYIEVAVDIANFAVLKNVWTSTQRLEYEVTVPGVYNG